MLRLMILCFAFGITLASCKSTEEIRSELAARDDADCLSIGAKHETQAYIDCRLKIKAMRAGIIAAEAGAPRAAAPRTCQTFGNTTTCF